MTPEQQRRVRDLFEAAVDHPSDARAAWIAREAGDDPVVRAEVTSLIDHDERAGSFLEHPALDHLAALLDDDAPAPGAVLGAYTIVRELGRGGMGRVYLASDSRLGRAVALKALAPDLTRDERQRERLRQEARAAASLTHPGICTVYALEEIDGELYIAAEYVDGQTLREEMRVDSRPSPGDVAATARALASALASAHDRGIMHRDLKPENVMRTRDGRLKILDFGLARIEAQPSPVPALVATAPDVLVGTPGYMAPEQLKALPVDLRADIFSLGVVLYEYATGTHPFEARSALATMARVLDGDPPSLTSVRPDLPEGLAATIERCLRKQPADRPQSISEIVGTIDHGSAVPIRPGDTTWWRLHQSVLVALYVTSAAVGWQIKEWQQTPASIGLFIALGIGATVACVLRGHMVFTERINRPRIDEERRRIAPGLVTVDVALSLALALDGLLVIARPLTATLTISLALGIALAAIVVEPATVRAAFGEAR